MRREIRKVKLKSILIFLAFVFFSGVNSIRSQIPSPPKKPANPPKANRNIEKAIENQSDTPVEKSIAADAKVSVKLCVAEGKLKINGWERDEIRAFVAGANRPFDFKVSGKSEKTNAPVSVAIFAVGSSNDKRAASNECLSGEQIELDVPRGASVYVKSRESETAIDSIAKATVENVGGDIYLSRISQGIDATTYDGDITVEKSGGALSLTTTTGNIVAFAVSPNDGGDGLKAKTNSGAIVLRQAEYRRIEATSNSGAIRFSGEILAGGQYAFSAFDGSINLRIPQSSSFKIIAAYGLGSFDSEIPLQNTVKSFADARAQNLSAQNGGGAATLNLSTYSGTIQIRKQ